MSSRFLMCGTFALAGSVGLFAQASPTVPPRAQGEKPVAGVVATVTLTGCLERWHADPAAASSDETAAKAPAGAEFMLTNVDGQVAPAPAAGGSTTPRQEHDKKYLLLSSPTLNLAAHVNHTVTIAGSITPQPSEGASPAEKIAEPSRAETNLPSGPRSEAYRLNLVEVSTVTMVARSCGK